MQFKFKKVVISLVVMCIIVIKMVALPNIQVNGKTAIYERETIRTLSLQQRQAMEMLEGNKQQGIFLNPDVNLDGEDMITVIVELKQRPAKIAVLEGEIEEKKINIKEEEIKVNKSQEMIRKHLDDLFKGTTQSYNIKYSYRKIFNGIAVAMPANKVNELIKSDVVKAIYNNEKINVKPIENEDMNINNINVLPNFGVDKLHEEGITGKGIKIGVIDTGIDYNHPDLVDAYKGGYDFVDNDNDPMETTYEDWQKSGMPEEDWIYGSYYTNHGTHVSGIIAGQGKNEVDYSITGVAPGVELYSYRVLGSYGVGYTEDVLAGIERAVEDEMDIINLSLGATYNNPLYATSVAINNAVLYGVTAVVASGNSGRNGMYSVGAPGTASLALTVGACDVTLNIPVLNISLDDSENLSADLKLMAKGFDTKIESLLGQTLNIVDVGYGYEHNYQDKDVNGKIAFMRRSYAYGAGLNYLIATAEQRGAAAIIIYNDVPGTDHIPYYLGEGMDYIPTFSVNNIEGLALKNEINEESVLKFNSMSQISESGDNLADFSSRGPVNLNYDIKPEIIAPGVFILSTLPSYMNGEEQIGNYTYAYGRFNGTSMATPYAAAVAALVLQRNPEYTTFDVKASIMNTADTLNGDFSVYEVGAGRINPYKAVHSPIVIKVKDRTLNLKNGKDKLVKEESGDLNFGVFGDSQGDNSQKRNIIIRNNTNEKKIFDVSIIYNKTVGEAKDSVLNGVKLDIDSSIEVKPNSTNELIARIYIPKTAELGNYEGYVVFQNKDNCEEFYRVPFAAAKIRAGIESFYMNTNTLCTPIGFDDVHNPNMKRYGYLKIKLSSSMKILDFIILDGNTNESIGYVGYVNAEGIIPNREISLATYSGYFYPFIGKGEDEITYDREVLPTGYYKIRMIATDSEGTEFISDFPFYIDNNLPKINELKIETINGEIDVEPNKLTVFECDVTTESSIKLTGICTDTELDELKNVGIDPFSRPGFENYFTGLMGWRPININKEGKIAYDLDTSTLYSEISWLSISVTDGTGNTSENDREVYLVKEGTPYLRIRTNGYKIKSNDDAKLTISLKNVEKIKELNFNLSVFSRGSQPIVDNAKIELLPEYQDKATLTYEIKTSYGSCYINGKIIFEDEFTSMDEEVILMNAELEHDENVIYNSYVYLNGGYGSYINTEGLNKSIGILADKYILEANNIYATITPYQAEGLLGGIYEKPIYGENFDYSSIGIRAEMLDDDGKNYEISYDKIKNKFNAYLPLEDKAYKLIFDVPGHFTVYRTVNIDRVGVLGRSYTHKVAFRKAIAGDVNKDNVIDILDAIAIKDSFGKNVRAADINADGIVDDKDMEYVVMNYLRQNPTCENPPKAINSYKGQRLEDILEVIN